MGHLLPPHNVFLPGQHPSLRFQWWAVAGASRGARLEAFAQPCYTSFSPVLQHRHFSCFYPFQGKCFLLSRLELASDVSMNPESRMVNGGSIKR